MNLFEGSLCGDDGREGRVAVHVNDTPEVLSPAMVFAIPRIGDADGHHARIEDVRKTREECTNLRVTGVDGDGARG